MRALALVLVVLVAGCVRPAAPAPEPAADAGDATLTFWLTETGFSQVPPPSGEPVRVASGNFFDAWRRGEGLPTWRGDGPDATVLATAVRVVAWAEAPSGAAQAGRFPSYIAYAGNAGFLQGQASLPAMGAVPPGDRRELAFDLALPVGGLVLVAGEPLELLLSPVQTNDDSAQRIDLLVGSAETPSRVEIVAAPVALPTQPPGEDDRDASTQTGTLRGSAYAPTGAVEGVSAARFPFDVDLDALEVVVTMTVTSHVGIPDVDLTLHAPDGTAVANSVTPYGVEAVRLLAPNLDAGGRGTWVAEVVDYGSAQAEFELAIVVTG